jgi:hypothetical protein
MIDQKQSENVEYFDYLGSTVTNDARSACEIKSRLVMAKAAFDNVKTLNLRKKLVECYVWSIDFYGAEMWTLQKVDQKYLQNFEMWCWRRIEKTSLTNRMRNEEVLQ